MIARALVRTVLLASLAAGGTGCARMFPAKAPARAPVPRLPAATVQIPPDAAAAASADESRFSERAPYRLRPGDPIVVYLRGIPREDRIEEIIDERGLITMPFIDDVRAAGYTASDLERVIQKTYIERKIYRRVNVNVVMASQSYFVQGEVRAPQRFPLVTGTTIMQAIAAAGGYTEYADPKRVTLTRGADVRVINMREIEKDPLRDLSLESGDVIRVPRSIF